MRAALGSIGAEGRTNARTLLCSAGHDEIAGIGGEAEARGAHQRRRVRRRAVARATTVPEKRVCRRIKASAASAASALLSAQRARLTDIRRDRLATRKRELDLLLVDEELGELVRWSVLDDHLLRAPTMVGVFLEPVLHEAPLDQV